MTKNDIIKSLEQIKGNPEVTVWNGMVGDYNHIGDITEYSLYKETKEYSLGLINARRQYEGRELINMEDYDYEPEYDLRNPLLEEYFDDVWINKNYDKKRIIILNLKPRGKEYFDRLGKVRY